MSEIIGDVATYLQAQGIGTVGTDIFKSYLPDTADAVIAILDTGGVEPDIDLPTKSPTFQIFIRAATYSAGKSKLDSIRSALHQKRNTNLNVDGANYYYYIYEISEGGHLGRNDKGLDEFSVNFRCLIR